MFNRIHIISYKNNFIFNILTISFALQFVVSSLFKYFKKDDFDEELKNIVCKVKQATTSKQLLYNEHKTIQMYINRMLLIIITLFLSN